MSDTTSTDKVISRRAALSCGFGLVVLPRIARGDDGDDGEIARVQKVAAKAGLSGFGVSKNDQYLALGDAPEKFRKRALEILVNLSRDYLKHFGEKGFAVHKAAGRMTVIMLANRASFMAYLGEDVPGLVGGVYNPEMNDLLLFDNRAAANVEAEKDNTLVLTHEAVHQLTFNTGLLRRGGDCPKAIVEGLANYAELRSPNGLSPRIGDLNHRRLISLPRPQQAGGPPVLAPVAQLIRDDRRIEARKTEQVAYSEAWLLVHYLMKTAKILPKFRDYLKAIAKRDDPTHRLDDWTLHLGDPEATDRELVVHLRKLYEERDRRR